MQNYLMTIACLLAFLASISTTNAEQLQRDKIFKNNQQYNVILILADDIGAEVINAYGGTSYKTPNINQLSEQGIRFTDAHAQPLCTPSRVKIMTGKHNYRNYQRFSYLPPKETTFAHMLKKSGYATSISGKWQLVRSTRDNEAIKGMHPRDAGFDEYFVWQLTPDLKGTRYWGPTITDNGKNITFKKENYGPTLINNRVLDFIERKKEQPFFAYYTMVLPHRPFVTTPDNKTAESRQEKFTAMVSYMDKMVGNIKEKVIDLGIADKTLILFIGDNGTDRLITSMVNGKEIKGSKGLTLSAGTHVPFIAWGGPTAILNASIKTNSNLIDFNDIMPTIAALTGATLPKAYEGDGQSIDRLIKGEQLPSKPHIFIHYDSKWSTKSRPAEKKRYAFTKRYKLYESGLFFNIIDDPLEVKALNLTHLTGNNKIVYQQLLDVIETTPQGSY
ncbi:MAG: arylsulfatase A [Psychromonas sp.]|jgi:arylsulfatase A